MACSERFGDVVVRVVDTTDRRFPGGKQFDWYTETGGIWQSVWLEARGPAYVDAFRVRSSVARGEATFDVRVAGAAPAIPDAASVRQFLADYR